MSFPESPQDRENDKQQYVFVIDRSPVVLGRDKAGQIVVVNDTTGGAGKVVIGDAAAALSAGHDVVFVAVAKSDSPEELELAEQQLTDPSKAFFYEYQGQQVRIAYVKTDPRVYALARDGFFSSQLWFLLQEQDHPEIRPNWDDRMWESFVEINRDIAKVVDVVAEPNARVFSHDGHVALVAKSLHDDLSRSDLQTMFVGHTAWPTRKFLIEHIRRTDSPVPEGVVRQLVHGIAENHDAVNFSSNEWATRFRDTASALGVTTLPNVTGVPVPLDSDYVLARAHGPKVEQVLAGTDGRPGVRDLAAGKFVIETGGRAEWYKNIDKVIRSEVKRRRDNPESPEAVLAVLSSVTRGVVAGYREHFEKDVVRKVDRANRALAPEVWATIAPRLKEIKREMKELRQGDERLQKMDSTIQDSPRIKELWAEASALREDTPGLPIRLVDGNNYDRVLAWMRVGNHFITPAHMDGYNLMSPEALMAADDKGATQAMSKTTGLSHHLSDFLGSSTSAVIPLTPQLVRASRDKAVRPAEKAVIREFVAQIADTTTAAIQMTLTPEGRALREGMHERMVAVVTSNKPADHMDKLNLAYETATAPAQPSQAIETPTQGYARSASQSAGLDVGGM